jgi:hypothetical protein
MDEQPVISSESDIRSLYVVRAIHLSVGILFTAAVAYIYYSALSGPITWWTFVAVGVLVIEFGVLVYNSGKCPLGPLHKKYRDPHKGLFEWLLGPRLGRYGIRVWALASVVGAGLLFM